MIYINTIRTMQIVYVQKVVQKKRSVKKIPKRLECVFGGREYRVSRGEKNVS